MKKLFGVIAFVYLSLCAQAQNWTAVSGTNITDLNQVKLAAGTMCFLGTDQNNIPISFNVGGGGQVLARPFCVPVTNGAPAALQVPNPANTQPAGIYYRVTVTDSSSGQTVLRYTQVQFAGASFNFDNYAPVAIGQFSPPSGFAITGNFTVNGNLTVTGSFAPGSINTGSVNATSVYSSSSPEVNVGAATFAGGAKCDGVTDDTAAFQAAVAQINTGGSGIFNSRKLRIPPGNCIVTIPSATFALQIQVPGVVFASTRGDIYDQASNAPTKLSFHAGASGGVGIQLGMNKTATISTISRSGNVVTLTFTALPSWSHTFVTGRKVVIAGVSGGATSFNGTFSAASASGTTVTYSQTGANESGSGGTVTEAFDAPSYDGAAEGFSLEGVDMECTNGTTPLLNGNGNYCNNTTGIQDWRGGSVRIGASSRVSGFQYGFWGIQSDLDNWDNSTFAFNSVGFYLGPRSDQWAGSKITTVLNDIGMWPDSVRHFVCSSCRTIWDGSSTTPPIRLDGAYSRAGSGSSGLDGAYFEDGWFEHFGGANSIAGFIEAGVGAANPVINVFLKNPEIETGTPGSPPYAQYLLTVGNADLISISYPKAPFLPLALDLLNFVGTTSPAQVRVEEMSTEAAGLPLFVNNGSGNPNISLHVFGAATERLSSATDNAEEFRIDSGLTASQVSTVSFADRGAVKWLCQKTTGNNFQCFDQVNSLARFVLNANGSSELNASNGANTVDVNVRSGTGTAGTRFGDGAGNVKGTVDGGGKGSFYGGLGPCTASGSFCATFTYAGTANRNFSLPDVTLPANCLSFPCVVASATATAQAANIASTALLSSVTAGRYEASCQVTLTQAATTSSTLPSCQLICNDPTDSVDKFLTPTATSASNATSSSSSNAVLCDAKGATNIRYQTSGYASSGATPMQYKLYIVLNQLQ